MIPVTGASLLITVSALLAAAADMPVIPGGALFENDQVKVMRALERAHVKGKAHEHKVNRIMVYLQPGTQRFEYQDGRKPEVFNWSAKQVKWSPADGIHAPEVTGDDSFNIVEVELKTPASGEMKPNNLDPLKLDTKHYSLEFENSQVRVVRVRIGAHESTPMHTHGANRVTIYLTDQSFHVIDSDGKEQSVQHKAGEAVWGTPLTHKEENSADQPFEAIMVELK